ncbi:MAG TPA: branched-chain amino acid ABC transporter permease [Frankiaceae bacterium]|jgi:branched-subunit amino acid ABC-type transport system permease component|nr:branched-chain amino acid ABC transporter permease [Frankiaceae bacterium]
MSVGVALQAVMTGLAQGAVYGLVALGFTLCYRLVRVLSFAHGDLIAGATFSAVLVTVGTTPVLRTPSAGVAVAQVVLCLVAGGLLGGLLYVVAVRPFGGELGWVAATVTAGLVVREALGLVLTREAYNVADPLRLPTRQVALPDGASFSLRLVAVLAIGLAVGVAVDRLLVASRYGKAMRAVADDADAASLMGVPTRRVVLLAFAVAGVLAGVAGLLSAPAGPVTVGAGVVLGLKGTTAALLGRLGSARGALAGGLALGVVEALVVAWPTAGPAYRDVLALTVLVVVLALRPEGLRASRRVA